MNWKHPTGQFPENVMLLALGDSHQEFFSQCMLPEPPEYITKVDEIWTVNRGLWTFAHDLLFVMDHITGEAETYPEYGKKLWKHNRPIITSERGDVDWPAHVHEYPYQEIQEWLLSDKVSARHADWWHNSVAYIISYAGFIGVKTLAIWGADYKTHRSGTVEDGHPNVAYWCGVMERVGLTVMPVSTSSFLGADTRKHMYGYLNDPRKERNLGKDAFRRFIMTRLGHE